MMANKLPHRNSLNTAREGLERHDLFLLWPLMASRPPWAVYGAEEAKSPGSSSQHPPQEPQEDAELGRAIQISADHIVSLIEEEKRAVYEAEHQKYRALSDRFGAYKIEQNAVLAGHAAHNQHLSTQISQMSQELRRVKDALNATLKEAHKVADLEAQIASLKETQKELQSQLQAKTTEAEDRMNQLGIYSGDSPGMYRFGNHWHRLFYEFSVELSRPVTPAELNQAIESIITLMHHRRGAAVTTSGPPQVNPHPQGSSPQIVYYQPAGVSAPGVPPQPAFAYAPPPSAALLPPPPSQNHSN
jgi:hypothetical protein